MSMMEAVELAVPSQISSQAPGLCGLRLYTLLVIVFYAVSLIVILAVLHRLYVHTFHFTPPYLRAYEELITARRLAQQEAREFDERARQFRQIRPIVQASGPDSVSGGDGDGDGTNGGFLGGASETHEAVAAMEGGASEVLSRLEQDLRATSLRERERLAVASTLAPTGTRSLTLSRLKSNSFRIMAPGLEFRGRLDGLHGSTQSATVSPLSSSSPRSPSSAAAQGSNNGRVPTHTRSISLQTLSEFDWSRPSRQFPTRPRRFRCGTMFITGSLRNYGADGTDPLGLFVSDSDENLQSAPSL